MPSAVAVQANGPRADEPRSGGIQGTIRGTVRYSGGPWTAGAPRRKPAAGTVVQLVRLATGDVVASATTDRQGRYEMSTKAARYALALTTAFNGCSLTGTDGVLGEELGEVTLPPAGVATQDVVCSIP